MVVIIKEISSKELDMDMVYGKIKNKFIRVVTEWIRNKDLVFTNGSTSKFIKDNLEMITDRDMDNFIN